MELMKNKKTQPAWRKYTFLALILSLLGAISAALLAMVQGLVNVNLYNVSNPDDINRWLLVSAGVIVTGFALYGILEPDKVSRFVTRRQTRYGSNVAIMTLAFLGILIVGNVIAYKNPVTVADFTADKENTLPAELVDALQNLPEKITATAFFSTGSGTETADKLLTNIKSNSNGKFDYSIENPDLNPVLAQQEGITGNGKILLKMGDRKEIASYAGEDEILKAIIRLTNPNARAVYFLTGHGEVGLDSGELNFSNVKQTLENKNYAVNTLNLITQGKIPEDALAIIVGGPQKPLADKEVELLKEYVKNGGALVVLQDPYIFTQFGEADDPLADYLAADWGIAYDNDVILDISSAFGPLNAVSALANQHPITQDINQNLIIVLPQARSLSITSQPEGVTQTTLIQTLPPDPTSINSWGEMNLSASENGQIPPFDEGVDIPGPLNMAIAGENTTTKGRVVVIGNSSFAASQNFDAYGNGNFFINSIDWAAEQEQLIQFTPRETTERTFVPPSGISQIAILLGSICLIPGLVVLAGVMTWLARRRQG
jgi:ABC-type uncharacterized transport system involved in gliding motility auxiliary subunit